MTGQISHDKLHQDIKISNLKMIHTVIYLFLCLFLTADSLLPPSKNQVVLPLYPQFSISTSGSSLRVLNEEFTRRPERWGHKKVVHTVVPSYHDRPGYINAMAALVAKEVAQFSPKERKEGVQVEQGRYVTRRSVRSLDSVSLVVFHTFFRDSTMFGIDLTSC